MEDSNDKVYGILAYLGILFLVPLLAGKTQFARFHANQGVVLFIADVILGILIGITTGVLGLLGVIGWILGGIISGVLGLGIFILMIMANHISLSIQRNKKMTIPLTFKLTL